VEVGKMAVATGAWILYEWQEGRYALTGLSRGMLKKANRKPIMEYLKLQGRFGKLTAADVNDLQADLDAAWDKMSRKVGEVPPSPDK
jgi:pyruvate ferredoxin oxidoreductase beta subunit